MSIGEWDALVPLGAAVALVVLVAIPFRGPLPKADLDQRQDALERGTTGQAVAWADQTRGLHGLVIPDAAFQGKNGAWCRPYSLTVVNRDGFHQAMTHRVACRLGQGQWRDRTETASSGDAYSQLAKAPN